ncbi:primosome assembly protein PriA [Gordonia amarae]|uniref:Probable replication restart protein PriA n=2 Tax=Gordonia amarae TaxID=36821 RepID=G7GIZ0_9ACTN|nr:primosomal protein N' [Gordonia amarae]QHN19894.1 primosome assembly protein PriA [Gordonia amarae]QHN24355.1 primosome assembly protein PriA [Gordonia amarae]QHN33279.1 primosome assembly protein PriA [Gordonia amarae]QHN41999.1 primosome assembly protein PriA [Gordonia amarae]GAB03565.1 primosomal protein n' [Gordonia amarae NBRC 15530]
MLGLAHLDRPFDYLVDAADEETAVVGSRVRIRFAGRLVDGFVLERRADSDHVGNLSYLDRVVSAEPVLTPELATLTRAVADRYAGTMSDVLRLAVPPRHARTEARPADDIPPPPEPPDLAGWSSYQHAESFIGALGSGVSAAAPHAVWQATPGEQWPQRLAELATATAAAGKGTIIVVPDQRDLDRLVEACEPLLGDRCVSLTAGLGPSARYRRWLAVSRGTASVVVGTRSAVFAPVRDLGLVVVWDDGDDSLAEPRAPYPHPREVGVLRAHQQRCGFLLGGYARTAEAQALVESGWAHDLVADRALVRARMPRVQALSDSDARVMRDPLAHSARIPELAFVAARKAIAADLPVLFSVPRRGYLPSLACARCRTHVRCRACHGPVQLDQDRMGHGEILACRWCGRTERSFRCVECGGTRVRALVTGARRTAEELGRAFAGVPVVTSGGSATVTAIEPGARVVVATPGVEPVVPGGYGAAVILDTWAYLDRADLRVAEIAVRRWLAIGALVRAHGGGGELVLVADAGIRAVQAVVRWDPVGFAALELAQRAELGFPPAVTMASVDGLAADVTRFTDLIDMPTGADLLGPVALPAGVRPPAGLADTRAAGAFDDESADIERVLVRVDRRHGRTLAAALTEAQKRRNTKHETGPVRVQVDPHTIG